MEGQESSPEKQIAIILGLIILLELANLYYILSQVNYVCNGEKAVEGEVVSGSIVRLNTEFVRGNEKTCGLVLFQTENRSLVSFFGLRNDLVDTMDLNHIVTVPYIQTVFYISVILIFIGIAILGVGIGYSVKTLQKSKEQIKGYYKDVEGEEKEGEYDELSEIIENMLSEDEDKIKNSILQVDAYFEKRLIKLGYENKNYGEALKNIPTGFINNIQYLWDIHKMRNDVAHNNENFVVDRKQMNQLVEKIKEVKKELDSV